MRKVRSKNNNKNGGRTFGIRENAPLILAWSVFPLCVAAVFGGLADGAIPRDWIFSYDTVLPTLLLRDLLGGEISASGWMTGGSPMFFPDYLTVAAGMLFGSGAFIFYFYLAANFLAYAFGWMLVAQKISADKHAHAAAVLAAAAHALLFGYGNEIFGAGLTVPVYRGGILAAFPYCLRLVLDINGGAVSRFYWREILLGVLAALLITGDVLFAAWFVLPAAAALAAARLSARPAARAKYWRWTAACVSGGVVFLILRPVFSHVDRKDISSLPVKTAGETLSLFWEAVMYFAGNNPLLFSIWIMFYIMLAFVCAAVLLPQARRFLFPKKRPGAKKTEKTSGITPAGFAVLFLTCSALLPFAAVVIRGSEVFGEIYNPFTPTELSSAFRYMYPALYLPLFAGWIFILTAAGDFLSAEKRRLAGMFGRAAVWIFAAGMFAAAAPKMWALREPQRMFVFDSPFFACLKETAARENLTAGMADFNAAHVIMAASLGGELKTEKMARVVNMSASQKRTPFIWPYWDITNKNYLLGEFDFILINENRNLIHISLWDDPGNTCAPEENGGRCINITDIIKGGVVRATFGEPRKIVDCGARQIYIYKPPVSLDGFPLGVSK